MCIIMRGSSRFLPKLQWADVFVGLVQCLWKNPKLSRFTPPHTLYTHQHTHSGVCITVLSETLCSYSLHSWWMICWGLDVHMIIITIILTKRNASPESETRPSFSPTPSPFKEAKPDLCNEPSTWLCARPFSTVHGLKLATLGWIWCLCDCLKSKPYLISGNCSGRRGSRGLARGWRWSSLTTATTSDISPLERKSTEK